MSTSEVGVTGAAEMAGNIVTARASRNLDGRLTIVAVRMAYVSLSFFMGSFYFGLVYLQLVNENNMWLPKGVNHPPSWIGVGEVACVLLAGSVYFWGQWTGLYKRQWSRLNLALWVAAVLGIVAVVLHVIELHKPGFSLQSGGYVSVFIAVEGVFTVLLTLTVIVLLGMANRGRLGLFREGGIAVEAFGEFLGWISAIALINFMALYVQPFFPIA